MSSANSAFKEVLSIAGEAAKSKPGFVGLLTDNTITLKNLLLAAVVVGLELLLSSEVFDCPLEHHTLYGVTFLLVPVFIVFITNVLLIGEVWRVSDRFCVKRYKRRGEFGFRVLPDVTKALVGPAVWLVASFADGTYYVCAAVGPDNGKRNLTNTTEIKELESEFTEAKTKSHLWAFLVLALMVVVTAVVMTTKKCCLKDNVLLEDDYVLERREAVAALLYFRHFIEHPHHHGDVANEDENRRRDAEAPNEEGNHRIEDNEVIKGWFMGKDEEIALYPEGIPEQRGKKWVEEEVFKGWSDNVGSFCYIEAYEKFVEKYPRITNGLANYAWVTWPEAGPVAPPEAGPVAPSEARPVAPSEAPPEDDATDGKQQEMPKKQYSRIPESQAEAVSLL